MEIKICGICHNEINLSKDNYVKLEDYFKGELNMTGYFHNSCYNSKLKGGEDLKLMKKQAFGLLAKARQMVGIEDEPQKVVIK